VALELGQVVPDFKLRAHDRSELTRNDLVGKRSLIVFMPFAFTRTCHGEMCSLRDNLALLDDLDANVVVVTCDTVAVNAKWSEENGFGFPVLSDFWPHGDMTKAYGAFNELYGAANRRTVVLDENAVARRIIETDALGTPREFDEYIVALSSIEVPPV
jgi:mycoredoxin-dependent peroxiredoxin